MPALIDAQHERFAQAIAAGNSQAVARQASGLPNNSRNYMTLKDPAIVKRIQELVSERLAMEGITANKTKRELARIGFADVRKLFDERGDLKPVHDLDDDTAAAVASITVEVQRRRIPGGGTEEVVLKKIKMAPKMDALVTLAKHFKIIGDAEEGVNQLANALADRLNAAKRRTLNNVEDAELVEPRQLEALDDGSAEPPEDTEAIEDFTEAELAAQEPADMVLDGDAQTAAIKRWEARQVVTDDEDLS